MSKRSQISDLPKDCPSDKALRLRHRGPDIGSSIVVGYLQGVEPDSEQQSKIAAEAELLRFLGSNSETLDLYVEFDSNERLRQLHPKLVAWKKAFLKIDNPVIQANRHLFLNLAKSTLPAKTAIKTEKKDYPSLGSSNQQQTKIAQALAEATKTMLDSLKKALAEDIILSELEAVGFRQYCDANSLDVAAQSDLAIKWFGTGKPVANTLETVCAAVQLLQPVVSEYAKERSTQKGVRSGLTGLSYSLCVVLGHIGIKPTRSENGVLCQLLKAWLIYWSEADSSTVAAARSGLALYQKSLG